MLLESVVEFFVVVFLIALIVGFWLYWPTTLFLSYDLEESSYTPSGLFLAALVTEIVLFVVLVCIAMIPFMRLVILLGGLLGWTAVLLRRATSLSEWHACLQEKQLPRMQCTMLDIYTAVGYFGVCMAIGTIGLKNNDDGSLADTVLPLAIYLFIATALGFYVGLDILRRESGTLSHSSRFLTLLGVTLVFTLSGLIGGFLVWATWRDVLRKAALQEWQRTRHAAHSRNHAITQPPQDSIP